MKRAANLPEIIREIELHGMRSWLIGALTRAFKEARKHKLKTFNEHAYEVNWQENIRKLADAILEHYYEPGSSVSFIVFDPMVREIFAAPFVDRIVHHLLYELQAGWWDHHFIDDSYSCREDKGTLYGILRLQRMMRKATENGTKNAYVIKLDIKSYFNSLPRAKLLERVKWGLDQQFAPYLDGHSAAWELKRLCAKLWTAVLLDDPAPKSRRRGPLSNWDKLPSEKSLYNQKPGFGIVIGNLTSQLSSNIYLDQLDRFVKFELGYKYYGRYVDDFFIVVPEEEYAQAKKDVQKIEEFLKSIGLTLHPKKRYYQSVYKGVSFLGARVYPHCLYPSNRLQKKLKSTLYKIRDGKVSDATIISYFGFFKHLDGDKYVKKLFKETGLDYKFYLEAMSNTKNRRPMNEIIADLRKSQKKRGQRRGEKG
jgi:RNA-directed DNA polymerase